MKKTVSKFCNPTNYSDMNNLNPNSASIWHFPGLLYRSIEAINQEKMKHSILGPKIDRVDLNLQVKVGS